MSTLSNTIILTAFSYYTPLICTLCQQPKIYSDRCANVREIYTQVFKELSQAYSEGNEIVSKQQNEQNKQRTKQKESFVAVLASNKETRARGRR